MKPKKQPALVCPIVYIGASARPMVAFSGFYESHKPPTFGNVRSIVPPHRNDHQNCQQSGYILHCCFVDCRPGGRRGNAEQAVARLQHPVASGEALVMLNQVMRSVLLQCVRMAIKMACDGSTFVRRGFI